MGTTSGTTRDDTGDAPPVAYEPKTYVSHGADDALMAEGVLAWLEAKRDETGLSWAEVSRRSGISENGLRKIRQGESTPKPSTVNALSRAFVINHEGLEQLRADLEAAASGIQAPVGARRGDGGATTYVTVGVASPRASRLDPETAGRLIRFLESSARAWLATAECTDHD